MLKDVTLGQFFPGQTPIHKLDPRTKLVLVIVYIVALFLAKWFVSYAAIAAFLALVIAMSQIRLKVVLKNLKPLLFIIILTALLNLFYGQGEPIAQFWIFKITKSGIQNAVFMVLRISLLVAGTFMLTYTTSPIALTDGLESLLSPLKKLPYNALPSDAVRRVRAQSARPQCRGSAADGHIAQQGLSRSRSHLL